MWSTSWGVKWCLSSELSSGVAQPRSTPHSDRVFWDLSLVIFLKCTSHFTLHLTLYRWSRIAIRIIPQGLADEMSSILHSGIKRSSEIDAQRARTICPSSHRTEKPSGLAAVLLPPEEFRYTDVAFPDKRLAYIRVMTIQPALRFNAVLECNIEAVKLTPAANYEALSYSWQMESGEDPSLRRIIVLNGKTKYITRNLYEGLLRLRREAWPKSRRLWVDAICINQSNPEEQSQQVSQMSLVYGYGSRTVVWLGEGEDPREDHNAHAVFACCMARYNTLFHPCIRHTWRGSDGSRHSICGLELDRHRKFYQGEMDVIQRTKVAMTVMRFFSKRYFKRRWILQELRNSNADLTRLYWGPFTCSLRDISKTVSHVKFFQSLSPDLLMVRLVMVMPQNQN